MVFSGGHQPIISKQLFDQVQDVMCGKTHKAVTKHDYLYRKCIKCELCQKSLTAEKQKGHVYYRCHTKNCPSKTVREDVIDRVVGDFINTASIAEEELNEIRPLFEFENTQVAQEINEEVKRLNFEQAKIKTRIEKLTDKLLDEVIDDEVYAKTKEKLLFEQAGTNDKLLKLENYEESSSSAIQFLELNAVC